MIKSLIVFGKTYAVTLQPELADHGECNGDDCEIKIGLRQCTQQRRDTLLHEVLHAVEHELDIEVKEDVIRRLATGLLAVMRQNPAFVNYLLAK